MNELMLSLQNFFTIYGSLGVFLGSFIEEIIAPIPSTLIIMGSSFFMMHGAPVNAITVLQLFFYVCIPASLGLTLGSLFLYGIGYSIGKPFINRWGHYLGFSWDDVEKTQKKFEESKSDDMVLLTLRAIPIIPSIAISTFCGIVRYKIKNYILITFLGSLVRAFILGFIGWQFGRFYEQIADQIAVYENLVIIGLVILVIGYVLRVKYWKKDGSLL
nr:VTT domain-containing protein [Methanobacterium alcaliphilum]